MWTCMSYNGTLDSVDYRACQDLGFAISVISLLYLALCFPLGLCCNTLLVVVNLTNKVSMTMPDVYFVNIAIAGLLLNLVAAVELMGPSFTMWPLWEHNNKVGIQGYKHTRVQGNKDTSKAVRGLGRSTKWAGA